MKLATKKIAKQFNSIVVPESNDVGYTGEYHNFFPWKPIKKRSVIIETEDALKELCEAMMEIDAFAYDTETNCLDAQADNSNFRCADITISWGEMNNYDIILGHVRDEDLDRNIDLEVAVKYLKPVFEREDVLIVGHNLKFDLHVIRRLGIKVRTKYLFDTMLASWICDENTPNGLKENSSFYMGVSQTKFKEVTESIPKEIKKAFGYSASAKVKDFSLVLVDEGSEYCTDDSFYTWCLYLGFSQLLEEEKMDKIFYQKMIPFLQVLLEMEEKGITVDIERLEKMRDEMQEDMDALQYEIYELAGVEFNISSSQQKCELLYGYEKPHTPIVYDKANKTIKAMFDAYKNKEIDKEELKSRLLKQDCFIDEKGKVFKLANRNYNLLEVNFGFQVLAETKAGAPSCDKNTLARLSKLEFKNKRKRDGVRMCKLMLEYSKLDKLKGTFCDGILEKIEVYEDGKCHPNFNQIGCVRGETLIPTTEGLIPIKELREKWEDGVRFSKELYILNKNMEKEITSHIVQFKDEDTKIIKTALGIEFECSPIHPLWCNKYNADDLYANKGNCRSKKLFTLESNQHWVKAQNITTRDYIKVPIGYNLFSDKDFMFNTDRVDIPNKISKELAEFLGIYYADGSLHDSNGSFSVRITNRNGDVIKRVKELSKELFNIEAKTYVEVEKNSATTYITSKSIAEIEALYEMKRGCINKTIPNCILKSSKESVKAFIKGLTLDCCVVEESSKKYIKFTLSNKVSAEYLQNILFNLGIISSKRQDRSKTNNVFHINIYNENAEKFKREIGFVEREKYIDFNVEGKSNHNYLVDNDCIWVKVSEVTDGHCDVYDFTVPTTHSFVSGAFISHNTDSGRISCSNPNLQQLPKADEEDKYQIRSVFIGSPYYLTDNGYVCETEEEADEYCEEEYYVKRKKILAIDYHNLEMVCLTHFSHDKNLSEMFANDDDAHGSTAVNMFSLPCTPVECKKQYPHLRQAAKTINFMLMYGGGATTLYENLKYNPYDPLDLGAKEYLEQYDCKNGVEVAQTFIDRYFQSYSGVAKFIRDQKRYAHKNKFVYTILGRKRRLPDINSSNGELSSKAERLSVNAAIQGTAGDITSSAQIRLNKERDLEDMLCYMLLQIHDELVYELPEEYIEDCVNLIKYDMEHPFGDKENQQVEYLRADYDVGNNYQEAK